MNLYEIAIIFHPDVSEEQRKEIFSKCDSLTQEQNKERRVEKIWDVGIRKFTYPIKKQRRGYYSFLHLKCGKNKIGKVISFLRTESVVMRQLTVKVERFTELPACLLRTY